MMRRMTVGEVIGELERVLPTRAPDLWQSLQAPVTVEDLALLCDAVAPLTLPADLVELLNWRNGGAWGGPWWPVLDCGHLLGAAEAATHYQLLCEMTEEWQWRRSWVPIAHEGWYQCGIELGQEQHGLVVDAGFPDPPTPLAPSLVAVLHASCAVIDAGLQDEEPAQVADGTYIRVEQRALIEPIYDLYGPTPTELPFH